MAGFRSGRKSLAGGLLAALLLAAAALALWSGSHREAATLLFPSQTSVLCDTGETGPGVRAWLETFLAQYRQPGLPAEKRLEGWDILTIEPGGGPDTPAAMCVFEVHPVDAYSEEFLYWGVVEGGVIRCEWAIQFEVTREAEKYRFRFSDRRTPGPGADAIQTGAAVKTGRNAPPPAEQICGKPGGDYAFEPEHTI